MFVFSVTSITASQTFFENSEGSLESSLLVSEVMLLVLLELEKDFRVKQDCTLIKRLLGASQASISQEASLGFFLTVKRTHHFSFINISGDKVSKDPVERFLEWWE